jgi:hypothetical protein
VLQTADSETLDSGPAVGHEHSPDQHESPRYDSVAVSQWFVDLAADPQPMQQHRQFLATAPFQSCDKSFVSLAPRTYCDLYFFLDVFVT